METEPAADELITQQAPASAPMSAHRSARSPRIEVITRGEPRRRWTSEQKQAIAAESLAPGVSPTDVARRHGIGTGQLYLWRRALLAAPPAAVAPAAGQFARVHVVKTRPAKRDDQAVTDASHVMPQPHRQAIGLIEIVLPDGTALRVDAHVDPRALRRVLSVLRG
jgi:transposase